MSKQSKKTEEPRMLQAFNALVDLMNDETHTLSESLKIVVKDFQLTGLEKQELKFVYSFLDKIENQTQQLKEEK